VLIQSDVQKAGELAEQLATKLRNSNGNLSVIYYKLEEILINYRKTGGDMDLVMPGIYEVDFEYNRTSPDGRSIWIAYADVLHDELCGQHGTLHKKVEAENRATGMSVVSYIMEHLKLPQGSAMIVAPVAGSILGLGVKAFCKHGGDCEGN
jgi:hypothetical protein